jgi:hypothetical protein
MKTALKALIPLAALMVVGFATGCEQKPAAPKKTEVQDAAKDAGKAAGEMKDAAKDAVKEAGK